MSAAEDFQLPPPDETTPLYNQQSTTPAPRTKPSFVEGKFTLSRAADGSEMDDIIYKKLSGCLNNLHENSPDRVTLIHNYDAGSAKKDAMIGKIGKHFRIFCGNGVDQEYLISSMGNNGTILWEKGGAVVGVMTFEYSDSKASVYIDVLCMNQLMAYSGGYQLIDFFVNCLSTPTSDFPQVFNLFSLSSVEEKIWWYEEQGFVARGDKEGWLQPMVMDVQQRAHLRDLKMTEKATARANAEWANVTWPPARPASMFSRLKSSITQSMRSHRDNGGAISTRKRSNRKRSNRKRSNRKRSKRN